MELSSVGHVLKEQSNDVWSDLPGGANQVDADEFVEGRAFGLGFVGLQVHAPEGVEVPFRTFRAFHGLLDGKFVGDVIGPLSGELFHCNVVDLAMS